MRSCVRSTTAWCSGSDRAITHSASETSKRKENGGEMSETKTIAIIGAGIGGFLLVAHLGALGHKIRLHDIDDSKLADLRVRGGVDTEGLGSSFSKLELATTDPAPAVNGADIILVATGGHRQTAVAKALAPLLRDGQTVLLIQGNTGGSLTFRRAL